MKRFLLLPLLLIALPLCVLAETPNLTGEWVLNPVLSDDVASVMKAARPSRPSGGGRGGGVKGGGMGGRGGGRGGGRPGGSMGRSQQSEGAQRQQDGTMMEEMKASVARLSIFHDNPELNVTDGAGLSQLFQCDGSHVQVWSPRGKQKAQADWSGGSLKIIFEAPEGKRNRGGRTEVYAIENEHLVVTRTVKSPGGGDPIRLRFVYQREN